MHLAPPIGSKTNFYKHNSLLRNRKRRQEGVSLQHIPYLPLYHAHFFPQNEHVKLGMRIIHGVLYLAEQRKFWSEIWGCVLYTGAYYTQAHIIHRSALYKGKYGNCRIVKCNCNLPFNWNVSSLVGNDYWICQEAICTNKPPFTIMYTIFEAYGKWVTL